MADPNPHYGDYYGEIYAKGLEANGPVIRAGKPVSVTTGQGNAIR